jgi:hypothetical protein
MSVTLLSRNAFRRAAASLVHLSIRHPPFRADLERALGVPSGADLQRLRTACAQFATDVSRANRAAFVRRYPSEDVPPVDPLEPGGNAYRPRPLLETLDAMEYNAPGAPETVGSQLVAVSGAVAQLVTANA